MTKNNYILKRIIDLIKGLRGFQHSVLTLTPETVRQILNAVKEQNDNIFVVRGATAEKVVLYLTTIDVILTIHSDEKGGYFWK